MAWLRDSRICWLPVIPKHILHVAKGVSAFNCLYKSQWLLLIKQFYWLMNKWAKVYRLLLSLPPPPPPTHIHLDPIYALSIIHVFFLIFNSRHLWYYLTLYHIYMSFNTFTNWADPDQAALIRAAWSWSPLFAYGNVIRYDPTLLSCQPRVTVASCFVYKVIQWRIIERSLVH